MIVLLCTVAAGLRPATPSGDACSCADDLPSRAQFPPPPPPHPSRPPPPLPQLVTPIFAFLAVEVDMKGTNKVEIGCRTTYCDVNESLCRADVVHKASAGMLWRPRAAA